MKDEIKAFLEDNKDLIIKNSKESWEEFYQKAGYAIRGFITEILLKANIDPVEVLGYIPNRYLYRSNIISYKILDSVRNIDDFAFCGCNSLTNITIPDSVKRIGKGVFYLCPNLTNIIYKGTKELWLDIIKGISWNQKVSSNCIIHCTDGDIDI